MICHIDADSFFASVLQRKFPKLRGKPLLALGMGGGCVIAASYEAKALGVRTGMPLKEAKKLCPKAECVPSDFAETGLASQQIEAILQNHCPVIEQYSIDEWFLDLKTLVGGVPFDPLFWAEDIQKEILNDTGLSVSIGISHSKLLAKMAGEEKKPAGLMVIEKHQIEDFLARRPAEAIPGIGRRRNVHAKANQWTTAWDIAAADTDTLKKLFGSPGVDLQRELRGEVVSPVSTEDEPQKSISRCRSFKPTEDTKIVWAYLLQHVSYCTLKMRTQESSSMGISVWVRDNQYRHSGVQLRLPQLMDTEEDITPYVRKAFDRVCTKHGSYTQTGFCLWDLHPRGSKQFSLFESSKDALQEEKLQESLDGLRQRYGRDVIVRGPGIILPQTSKKMLSIYKD